MIRRLGRSRLAARGRPVPRAPARIAHLGLGAFGRSHQAWYTANAPDADDWGIVGYTGRRPDLAIALSRQDGLFALLTRSDDGDRAEIVPSLVGAIDGSDTSAFVSQLVRPETGVVTLTITESGYRIPHEAERDDPLVADLDALRSADLGTIAVLPALRTPLARLLLGLEHRRRESAAPIAIVPCDNLPSNALVVRTALERLAERVFPELPAYLQEIAFVSTSVDRITPHAGPEVAVRIAELTGFDDAAPVVAEPYSSWLLSGDFPLGRPDWEGAGARFVAEIEPFELRKLWLLNGAHSLLAYSGLLRRRATVAEAASDESIAGWMEEFWDEAVRHLPSSSADLELDGYRAGLRARFANTAMDDALSRIAENGVAKLRARVVPVLRAERAAGRAGAGAARILSAWLGATVRGLLPSDVESAAIRAAMERGADAHRALIALIDPELAEDVALAADLTDLAEIAV